MGMYNLLSTVLTVTGYVVLCYHIVFELNSKDNMRKRQEQLCIKWLIFIIFLKIEFTLLTIVEIIPLGSLLLLLLKLLIFLPENALSQMIYKKIKKHLEKVKLEDYNSRFGTVLSYASTHLVKLLMKIIEKIAAYIDYEHIEEAQKHILSIIKILEYKKSAINLRHRSAISNVNKDLNHSEFNTSMDSSDGNNELASLSPNLNKNKNSLQKTEIGNTMSKILTPLEDDDEDVMRVKAEVMIVRPDKARNQKAVYEAVEIEYFKLTSKVSFRDKNSAVESGHLTELRWVTKNMMNIECKLGDGRSKLIKLADESDVFRWVEPVCVNIMQIENQRQKDNGSMGSSSSNARR